MTTSHPGRLTLGQEEHDMAQKKPSITGQRVAKDLWVVGRNQDVTSPPRGQTDSGHHVEVQSMPPEGPSNIIVVTPNPLPPPKDVRSPSRQQRGER